MKNPAVATLCLSALWALVPAAPLAGPPPNIPRPVFPNALFWKQPEPIGSDGWRLQENLATGHWRLLDTGNIRRAWGGRKDCQAAYQELTAEAAQEGASPAAEPEFNIPSPTLGGAQFWMDHRVRYGWRMQSNALTGHWRVLDPSDIRRAWGTPEAMESFWETDVAPKLADIETEQGGPPEKIVIFLNGIGRSKASWFMNLDDIRERAETDHRAIEAWAVNYPSMRVSIEDAADGLADIIDALPPDIPLVFVCHSMGGLLANTWLERRGRPASEAPHRLESIVYLGTPFKGSEWADALVGWWVYDALYGPAGGQLTAAEPHLEGFAWPDCRSVCVAGSRAPEGFSPLLEGDDDGTVPVASALPEEATERLLVETRHSYLMYVQPAREKIVDVVFE